MPRPCARRGSAATRRRNAVRGSVWRLSKFTTQSVGTWSRAVVSGNSETRSRAVRVSAATTTEPMRSATGSRVSRAPAGRLRAWPRTRSHRAASSHSAQSSAGPQSAISESELSAGVSGDCLPSGGVELAPQRREMTMQCFAQQRRSVDAELVGPALQLRCFSLLDAKADHRHTKMIQRMTSRGRSASGQRAEQLRRDLLLAAHHTRQVEHAVLGLPRRTRARPRPGPRTRRARSPCAGCP